MDFSLDVSSVLLFVVVVDLSVVDCLSGYFFFWYIHCICSLVTVFFDCYNYFMRFPVEYAYIISQEILWNMGFVWDLLYKTSLVPLIVWLPMIQVPISN